MSRNQIRTGPVQECWNASKTRILKYTMEMYHDGLKEHKSVSAPDSDILENKVRLHADKWAEKWELLETKCRINREKEANLEEANSRTEAAITSLKQIDNLLVHTLSIDDTVNWENLKNKEEFPEKIPVKPPQKRKKAPPPKPDKQSVEFTPVFSFFEKLLRSKKERKIKEYEDKYTAAISDWESLLSSIDRINNQLDKEYDDELKKWETDVVAWNKRKNIFLQKQAAFNEKIDKMKESYLSQDTDSIIEYCEMVINNSEYPDAFPKNFELEYNSGNKILVIEYELPSIECFPKIKDVKFVASKNELKESFISESQLNKMFDDAMYKITLRTIHEIFEADVADAIDAVSFNGWVKAINRATGIEENNCILSIQTKKSEFLSIDLSNVDPRSCFKKLKGSGLGVVHKNINCGFGGRT